MCENGNYARLGVVILFLRSTYAKDSVFRRVLSVTMIMEHVAIAVQVHRLKSTVGITAPACRMPSEYLSVSTAFPHEEVSNALKAYGSSTLPFPASSVVRWCPLTVSSDSQSISQCVIEWRSQWFHGLRVAC